jgi:hypothetical protein
MADIERKLATVRRIAAIDPIEGADKIECVTVDGWKLVSGKDNGFQVGSLVIYFEIDSFLPVREEFEWLRKSSFKTVPGLGEGFRIKTIKLRGQVSQGLIVPMAEFLQGDEDGWFYGITLESGELVVQQVEEGSDLTDFLGVKKYEKPLPAQLAGRVKGSFPSFIRKTDQERIQNCWGGVKKWILQGTPEVTEVTDAKRIESLELGGVTMDEDNFYFKSGDLWFEKTFIPNDPELVAKHSRFEATLKLDGSSITIYYNDGQLGVCSRNLDLKREESNSFWRAAIDSGILAFLAQYGRNIAFQGELMGPGVQENREGLSDLAIYIYDIFDIDTQSYLTPAERYDVCNDAEDMEVEFIGRKDNIHHIPIIDKDIGIFGDETVDAFLAGADNIKSINHAIAEGIVYKSHVKNGPTFKAISNKFLLKEKD